MDLSGHQNRPLRIKTHIYSAFMFVLGDWNTLVVCPGTNINCQKNNCKIKKAENAKHKKNNTAISENAMVPELNMDVSKNRGTPKSSILTGFSMHNERMNSTKLHHSFVTNSILLNVEVMRTSSWTLKLVSR